MEFGLVQWNLTVNGDVILGTSNANVLTLNAGVNTNLLPFANNSVDLGSFAAQWRNLYLAGGAIINGNTTFGASAGRTTTFNAEINSSLVPTLSGTYNWALWRINGIVPGSRVISF